MNEIYSMSSFEEGAVPAFPDMNEEQIQKIMDDLDERLRPKLRENELKEANSIKAARDIILSV